MTIACYLQDAIIAHLIFSYAGVMRHTWYTEHQHPSSSCAHLVKPYIYCLPNAILCPSLLSPFFIFHFFSQSLVSYPINVVLSSRSAWPTALLTALERGESCIGMKRGRGGSDEEWGEVTYGNIGTIFRLHSWQIFLEEGLVLEKRVRGS